MNIIRFKSFIVILVLWSGMAMAQGGAGTRVFNIPSQPTEKALTDFGVTTGLQVLFATKIAAERQSPAVKGELTDREALERLLLNSGLKYEFVNERTVRITSASAESRAQVAVPSLRLAQEQGGSGGKDKNASAERQTGELIVTSTRETGVVNQGVIPREENQAVRYDIISREEIDRSGATSLPDLMRRLTSNQEVGTTTQRILAATRAGSATVIGTSDQINLRGLGANQTLVMINGRRVFGSDTGIGPDIGRIPLSAVERVEVLPSSGSAIYGANSVGGVVNIIMRRGYRGTEMSAYLGTTTEGGGDERSVDLFHGTAFNGGRTRATLALGFQDFGVLRRGQRPELDERALAIPALQQNSPFFADYMLGQYYSRRPIIYTSSPLGLGIPSNPTARFATVPAGSNGLGLTPASFNGTANTAALSTEASSRFQLRNASRNYSAILNLEQDLWGERLEAYTELTLRKSKDWMEFPMDNFSITLFEDDPLNPFGEEVTPGFVGREITIYRYQADLPDNNQSGTRTTQRVVAGLRGKWSAGERAYSWSLDASWDRNETDSLVIWSNAAIELAAPLGFYNLFRDLTGQGLLPQAEIDKMGFDWHLIAKPTVSAANFRINGDLLPLWGGPAKFSLGSEIRHEEYWSRTTYTRVGEYNCPGLTPAQCAGNPTIAVTDRKVLAAYGEITLPLVGERNRLPWLYSADISAGMRYEKYEDFEAARPPLVAAKFGLTPDIALRAAYSEGFQPPSQSALTMPLVTSTRTGTSYTDPLRPGATKPSYTNYRVGNPDLRPETARTWDAGIVLTPRLLPGLTLNASYFRYDKRDNVQSSITLQQAIVLFPELVVRGPQSAADIAANRPGPVTAYYNIPVNIARQFTDGVDLSATWKLPPTALGQLTLVSNGTLTKTYFSQTAPNQPEIDGLGLSLNSGFALERKISTSALWSREALSASLTAHYIGSFETATTNPTARNPAGRGWDGDAIDSQVIFDLQLQYALSAAPGSWQWLADTRWTLGAMNLFDTMPALWSDLTRGFASPHVDPRQRYVYLKIGKNF